ncbi:DUF1990 family protein [Arthrobacter caoxuetaonis]|uniref:DUF1990 domain-containing protein n=1 Tax=Arthrobacter caoxuetaonis TaxID=2886935 RepID=A0A9X1SD27_9MICC|nr:DUF1990 domain-containing protein [Arthrobacter caoxuetaonis]MCC3298753.1 DUF1990 domain-containing protein [Arthrobacter caoxuetaonis]USQ57485.1 DUF1990 domain-containing protein [Arthrobacter caoxuetaonis]
MTQRKLTYPDPGLTERPYPVALEGGWPPRYRLVLREERVSVPDPALGFLRLADGLLGWALHRGSGLWVDAGTPRARPGLEMSSGVGIGPLRWHAPCRVLWSTEPVIDGSGRPVPGQRAGFGYGTLRGHPEAGEEGFYAELSEDGQLFFRVAAFSRPANLLIAVGGPLNRRTQELITRRYFRAARRLALGEK